MNSIKKMKAISKLLGGCLTLVSVTTEQLMMKAGLQSKFETLNDQLRLKETHQFGVTATAQLIQKQIDVVSKDVVRLVSNNEGIQN